MVTGTIYNTLKLQTLDNKWQQKKNSENVLSRDEINERANWTQEDWLKHDFEEQLEKNKEAAKKTEIDNKIMYGGTLTPEEEKYLEQNNPEALQKYRQMKAEKKAYEEKLRNCKTKDEVQRLKTNTLNGYLSSFKKIENNPCIPLSEKLAKAQEMLGKSRNIQEAERKFMATSEYQNMPTEAEEAKERAEERSELNEEVTKEISKAAEADKMKDGEAEEIEAKEPDDAVKAEDGNEDIDDKKKKIKPKKKEISLEIEETYDRVRMQADLDDIENVNPKTDSPKTVGGNIDLAL